MSYESVSGFGSDGFGDEMSDLLSGATPTPTPSKAADWTTQVAVPPVYTKAPAMRVQPPTVVMPLPMPLPRPVPMPLPMPLTRPPPIQVTPPSGQRPPMRPKVVFGPPPFTGGSAPLPSECPSCQAAKEIPWIWIVVAVVVGGGAGYMIKQQMKKKPGEEGGTP